MRILERHKIFYQSYGYDHSDGKIDGVSVASKIKKEPKEVYKTLIAQGYSGRYHVFVIP